DADASSTRDHQIGLPVLIEIVQGNSGWDVDPRIKHVRGGEIISRIRRILKQGGNVERVGLRVLYAVNNSKIDAHVAVEVARENLNRGRAGIQDDQIRIRIAHDVRERYGCGSIGLEQVREIRGRLQAPVAGSVDNGDATRAWIADDQLLGLAKRQPVIDVVDL